WGYADRSETSAPSDSSLGLKFGRLTRNAVAAVNGPRVATTAPVPAALPTSRSPRITAALGFVLDRFRYEAGSATPASSLKSPTHCSSTRPPTSNCGLRVTKSMLRRGEWETVRSIVTDAEL